MQAQGTLLENALIILYISFMMENTQTKNLIKSLLQYQESEWLEFKENNAHSDDIGKNISAISNSITLLERNQGYILWGVDNKSKEIIGTTFRPKKSKVGNEELENWLLKLLSPNVDFRIYEEMIDNKSTVLLEIKPTIGQPISFHGVKYIRVGSYTKKLKEYPEKEKSLWRMLDTKSLDRFFNNCDSFCNKDIF